MKVSEITVRDLVEYMRLDENVISEESNFISQLLNISKIYITNQTGIARDKLDNYEDFVIVIYVLVQDMYDNRTLYVDNSKINKVVDGILGQHAINLL